MGWWPQWRSFFLYDVRPQRENIPRGTEVGLQISAGLALGVSGTTSAYQSKLVTGLAQIQGGETKPPFSGEAASNMLRL